MELRFFPSGLAFADWSCLLGLLAVACGLRVLGFEVDVCVLLRYKCWLGFGLVGLFWFRGVMMPVILVV